MNDIEKAIDESFLEALEAEQSKDKNVLKTIALLRRRLAGDNPPNVEWRANSRANAKAIAYAYAKASTKANTYTKANTKANAYAYAYAKANAYDKINTYAYAYDKVNAYAKAKAYACDKVNAYAITHNKTKSAIYDKLKKFIKPVQDLDLKIYTSVEKDKRYKFEMDDWESDCGTTYCRAGAATMEHPRGGELVKYLGYEMAGEFIYLISTGRAPHFYGDTAEAWEDIKKCAGIKDLY